MLEAVRKLLAAIDAAYEREKSESRAYLGASMLGKPCDAFLAYGLRGFPEDPFPGRVRRIFLLGHKLEDQVIADLRKAGAHVWDKDGLTGRQHAYASFGGHVRAHADGLVELDDGVLRVLEIKSLNKRGFTDFKDRGVKSSHPVYYDQCMVLMGLSGIHSCLFIAYSKDDSEYHAEIVEFDEFEWSYIQNRIETVLSNQARRIANDPTDWRCKFCPRKSVCWGDMKPKVACQTCAHAIPTKTGTWHCTKKDSEAVAVCDGYETYTPKPKE